MNILSLWMFVCGEVLHTVLCNVVVENITESTGVITSPDEDNDGFYDNNINYIWQITTSEGSKMKLETLSIQIEYNNVCRYDYLTIVSRKYLYGKFCGIYIPPVITTHGNYLGVNFFSDHNITFEGFTMTFNEVDADAVCGTVETLVMGTFGILGAGEGVYDQVLDCIWTIISPLPLQLEFKQVYITYMNTEYSEDCSVENIMIYDDYDEYAITFCGAGQPGLFNTSTRAAFVEFHSIHPGEGRGFSAVYTMTDKDSQCGGIILEPFGYIAAPDDDHNGMYDFLRQCYWALVAPNSSLIEIHFISMALVDSSMCAQESIEFYDGYLLSSAYVARYCGKKIPPTLLTQTNILYVLFISTTDFDQSNGVGFNMTYRHMNDSEIPTTSTLRTSSIVSTELAPVEITDTTTSVISTSDTTVQAESTTE